MPESSLRAVCKLDQHTVVLLRPRGVREGNSRCGAGEENDEE